MANDTSHYLVLSKIKMLVVVHVEKGPCAWIAIQRFPCIILFFIFVNWTWTTHYYSVTWSSPFTFNIITINIICSGGTKVILTTKGVLVRQVISLVYWTRISELHPHFVIVHAHQNIANQLNYLKNPSQLLYAIYERRGEVNKQQRRYFESLKQQTK